MIYHSIISLTNRFYQEGAMRMAKMGYTYEEILHFYYEDVHMVDLESLDFFKAEF